MERVVKNKSLVSREPAARFRDVGFSKLVRCGKEDTLRIHLSKGTSFIACDIPNTILIAISGIHKFFTETNICPNFK